MNISQIYEKEKEYKFFKLLSETNDKGIIRKEFKEYKLKAYIDYQSYNSSINPIKSVDTRENLVGIIRIPTLAIDNNKATEKLEITNGDYIVYENKKYELIEVRKIKDELKNYYTFYLTDYIDNITFDSYKTELNMLFFNIFTKLGIEAVVYHSFFQNSYFEKIDKPFLTYEITQSKSMSDYTTFKEEISKKDRIEFKYRSNRTYKMMIKLYDKNQVLNLDTILSKNKIFNHIVEDLNFDFEYVSEIEIQKLDFISESDTIINNKIMNEKVYSLEFTVDTFYSYETDYIEKSKIKGKIENGG